MTLRIAIPDLVSPSYFPVIAAIELGYVQAHGYEATLVHRFPGGALLDGLGEGEYDYVGASAHAALHTFPDWEGCRLVCALSQGMYWFLVVRPGLDIDPHDLRSLRGLRIGAAPGPDDGLRYLLRLAGLDAGRDLELGPMPTSQQPGVSFGVAAAAALEEGSLDGFWANGMGAEVAVRRGAGKVVLDCRRGPRPRGIEEHTFPALITTQQRVQDAPEQVEAIRAAIIDAQLALAKDPQLARAAARPYFPDAETDLIADLIARDVEFYDPTISDHMVQAMHRFATDLGLTSAPTPDPDTLVVR